jgi:hypothetical protein
MNDGGNTLYPLLPAIYRDRDADRGYPLRALLSTLAAQGAVVDADIAQLYENLFIETCKDWVVPYIGDLVSNRALYDAGRISQPDTAKGLFTDLVGTYLLPPLSIRARADVANTIYYRQRKATPAMLEELARDVTGWPAHVVEFFQLLGWTQFLEHQRLQCEWLNIRCNANGSISARSTACSESTVPSTSPVTPSICARPGRKKAGTTSVTSASFSGVCRATSSRRRRPGRRR